MDPSAPASDAALNDTGNGPDSLSNFGPSSGTVVGNRALELRDEVLRLRASVNLNSSQFAILRSGGAAGAVQYHSTVAAITARLQSGTTRGNPILLRQWQEANTSLEEVTTSLGRLNSLQTAVDADASLASYLLESVQAAFQLSGAIDEDLDQLKLLRDEVSRLVVQLDYLRNQITNDIERQSAYVTSERQNLQALAFAISRGELLGNSLANRPVIVNTPLAMNMPRLYPAPWRLPAGSAHHACDAERKPGPHPDVAARIHGRNRPIDAADHFFERLVGQRRPAADGRPPARPHPLQPAGRRLRATAFASRRHGDGTPSGGAILGRGCLSGKRRSGGPCSFAGNRRTRCRSGKAFVDPAWPFAVAHCDGKHANPKRADARGSRLREIGARLWLLGARG